MGAGRRVVVARHVRVRSLPGVGAAVIASFIAGGALRAASTGPAAALPVAAVASLIAGAAVVLGVRDAVRGFRAAGLAGRLARALRRGVEPRGRPAWLVAGMAVRPGGRPRSVGGVELVEPRGRGGFLLLWAPRGFHLEAPALLVEDECCRGAVLVRLESPGEGLEAGASLEACAPGGCAAAELRVEGGAVEWSLESPWPARLLLSWERSWWRGLPWWRGEALLAESGPGARRGTLSLEPAVIALGLPGAPELRDALSLLLEGRGAAALPLARPSAPVTLGLVLEARGPRGVVRGEAPLEWRGGWGS